MGMDMYGGFIFLGAVGFLIIVLVITYCCVKYHMCCCQKPSKKTTDNNGDVNESLLGNTGDNHDDDFRMPYNKIPLSADGQFSPGSFKYVRTDDSDRYTSEEDILSATEGSDILAALPKSYMSVRTGAFSIETDSQFDRSEILGLSGKDSKMVKDTYVDGCRLKLSLLYSKSDMFLMLTVIDVSGMPTKASGGYKFIRVAISLLPEKKYHSKTKVKQVTGEDVIPFGDSFKFSSVSRESLFTSAFRFRLYAKNKRSKEVCAGEIFLQLADVAQRSFGFVTTKLFERKRKR